jgi:hypothetical protein
MQALARALRQVWMRRLDDPRLIDAVLRHPAFVDRAPLERALSARFFAPFCHQEVTRGARFETRARWSRAIFAAVGLERVRDAAIRAFDAHAPTGESESLLDSVRACVARATTELTFGDLSLEPLVQRAVRDIDRSIKMIGRADLTVRRALRDALEPVLDCTDAWPEATSLGAARAEARCLPLSERVDHVGAVLLATGVIQVSDTVTHALIALAQHPAAAAASDDALVAEVVRAFPVNASITRAAGVDVTIEGARFQRGEAVTIVPRRRARALGFDPSRAAAGSWSFGAGARACPARRVAATLAATLLGRYRALGVQVEPGYRHERSLALAVRASFGDSPAPARTPPARRAVERARYLAICAESYPRAFLAGLPEVWAASTT